MMNFRIPDTPEELLKQTSENFSRYHKWLPLIVSSLAAAVILFSGFYAIDSDEAGVVCRLGRYSRTTSPGLHWLLPFNLERVEKVKVKRVLKEEFGYRTGKKGARPAAGQQAFVEESVMLTGDMNVLEVTWIIQYHIADPVQYLFKLRTPRETLRDVSEAVMRQVIGDSSVHEALTTRRTQINLAVQKKIQEILDSYHCGIQIETVKLQDVNPPDQVKPSFNQVNEAKQEKETMINEAWGEYNKVIPQALGEAEKVLLEAEGYESKRLNEARGEAANFLAQWEAYKGSKEITRRRIYMETMAEVMPQVGRLFVVEPNVGKGIPLLNLKEGATDE